MTADLEWIIELREGGAFYSEIAGMLGVSRQAVIDRVKRAERGGRVIRHPARRETIAERRSREGLERKAARSAELEAKYRDEFVGRRFGTLTGVDVFPSRKKVIVWCDCGARSIVDLRHLRHGRTTSCGSQAHTKKGWVQTSAPPNVFCVPEDLPENPCKAARRKAA